MTISHRLADALALAVEAHDGQVRKGTQIRYISHPLAVASLVLEYGGSEDQAIAGLLHDAIEDGGSAYAPRIAAAFGPEVLALVEACSDGTAESKAKATTPAAKKADWRRRKLDYLKRLETEDPAALLVTRERSCRILNGSGNGYSNGSRLAERVRFGITLRLRRCCVGDNVRWPKLWRRC
jgi:(p)ppGpp synthase/HD superfamily hydrolase